MSTLMTLQDAFDVISVHLLKQNKRSVDPITKRCLYRSKDGCKCAIGVLIPDNRYFKYMEGCNVWLYIVNHQDLPFTHLPTKFFEKAQKIHDHYRPKEWENKLRKLAVDYNLITKRMDNFLKEKQNERTY